MLRLDLERGVELLDRLVESAGRPQRLAKTHAQNSIVGILANLLLDRANDAHRRVRIFLGSPVGKHLENEEDGQRENGRQEDQNGDGKDVVEIQPPQPRGSGCFCRFGGRLSHSFPLPCSP